MSSELKVGVFVFISIIILLSTVFWLKGSWLVNKSYEIEALFTRVDGLRPGAPIQMAGVDIGRVKKVSLTEKNKVLVSLCIKSFLHLREGTKARISSTGVLGEKKIEIIPGSAESLLRTGSKIPGEDPLSAEKLLDVTVNFFSSIDHLTRSVDSFINDEKLQESLNRTVGLIEKTSAHLTDFSANLGRINLPNLVGNLNATVSELREAIQVGKTDFTDLTTRLDTAADNLTLLEKQTSQFLEEIRNGGETARQITVILSELASSTGHLKKITLCLSEESENFGPLLEETRQTIKSINSAANNLNRILNPDKKDPDSLESSLNRVERFLEMGDRFFLTYSKLSLENQFDLSFTPDNWGIDYRSKLNWNPQDSFSLYWEDIGDEDVFSLLYGREYPSWQFETGILHDWLGLGVGYRVNTDLSLHGELWRPNDPIMSLLTKYRVKWEGARYHIILGAEDLLAPDIKWRFSIGREF